MSVNRCPACNGADIDSFAELRDVPVFCNVLWKTAAGARQVAKGSIRLGFCATCEMVYNLEFDAALVPYTSAYENSLHFSPRFQRYACELVNRLVAEYDLNEKRLVEIGGGKGDFLTLLCKAGRNVGLGVDPGNASLDLVDEAPVCLATDMDAITAWGGNEVDLVVCRQMLEHIPQPRQFLLELKRILGTTPAGLYFEVPNALFTLRGAGVWDVSYQHCSFFGPRSLARLFVRSGFRVQDVYTAFENQFLCLQAIPAGACGARRSFATQAADLAARLDSLGPLIPTFSTELLTRTRIWNERLAKLTDDHHRITVWGVGSKGVTFLNTVEEARAIPIVVDVNPRKQGKYVAGTGQRVIAPSQLPQYAVDTVLVMNSNYESEVRSMLRDLGVPADVYTV